MKKTAALIPLFALLGLSACSFNAIALRSTASLMERGIDAYYDEPDPQLAKEAMASQLKFVEGLLQSGPKDGKLNLLAAEGFGSYAFLFIEDSQPERAKELYLRGSRYAERALLFRGALSGLTSRTADDYERVLKAARREDAPGLFWMAFCGAGFVNLSKDSPEAVSQLPVYVALMKRAHELDPDYEFAGSDQFFGVYFASRPKLFGGDTDKAAQHFKWAERLTGGQYLMTYLLQARYLAVALQDKAMFQDLLAKVRSEPAGRLPHSRLADEVAKLKAAALMEKTDDLF